MVEEVGGGDVEDGAIVGNALVGDSSGQVGLAAAAGTGQYQPSGWLVGELAGGLVSTAEPFTVDRVVTATFRRKPVKGEAGERAEITVALQVPVLRLLCLYLYLPLYRSC
jgi:hypothetical protein